MPRQQVETKAPNVAVDQPESGAKPAIMHGEVLQINGAWFRAEVETGKKTIVLAPTGDGKLSKAPWRVIRHSYQGRWVPAVIDDKDRIVALVFGKDTDQQDANAVAILQAHLYQPQPEA